MNRALIINRIAPGASVQDLGRPGFLAFGVSRGGAADRLALVEGAALLRQPETCAAIEMAGTRGEFVAVGELRIALTGAPMRASLDGTRLEWNACHEMPSGAKLSIGPAEAGTYGYLHIGGGVETEMMLSSRSAHLAAGLGAALQVSDHVPIGADAQAETNLKLPVSDRFNGGIVRVLPSLQTAHFPQAEVARFEATAFQRDARGNRMGVRLVQDGPGFESNAGLSILSEVIVPGDIQITGDGTPFVLLSECQTTGGYPRIGSVLPSDLPIVAQACPGATLQFQFVTLADAVEIEKRESLRRRELYKDLQPVVRDPAHVTDLLVYQLISGVTAGRDLEE